jgi:hypothetical protein
VYLTFYFIRPTTVLAVSLTHAADRTRDESHRSRARDRKVTLETDLAALKTLLLENVSANLELVHSSFYPSFLDCRKRRTTGAGTVVLSTGYRCIGL